MPARCCEVLTGFMKGASTRAAMVPWPRTDANDVLSSEFGLALARGFNLGPEPTLVAGFAIVPRFPEFASVPGLTLAN